MLEDENAVTGDAERLPVLGVAGLRLTEATWGATISVVLADGNQVHFDWYPAVGRVRMIGVTVLAPEYLGTIIGDQGYLVRRLEDRPMGGPGCTCEGISRADGCEREGCDCPQHCART